ncbi:MAG: phosphoribosylanthranilate isomerase [Rhodospirillales bacterium]|nr:phosphoribosylanthranilate isomerase [Rhodospirillales bacterium]
MPVDVKICGLKTTEAVAAAVVGGARFLGFVFFAPSPRCVTAQEAVALGDSVPSGATRVGLVVDAPDEDIAEIVSYAGIDMLQLHGSETPERVADIRRRFGIPVMKAVAIADDADVERAAAYEPVADWLLFDARPPKGASRPGGNAQAFDWSLLRSRQWRRPWMLAGGLTADNLEEAVRASGATVVDVSSGVEDAPGEKNPDKISAFLRVAATVGLPDPAGAS